MITLTSITSAVLALGMVCTVQAAVSPKDVDAAILNGKKYLFEKQEKDGTWEREFDKHGDQKTGQTALVVHALLSAGESHQDERLVKAIDYLKSTPTTGVYALGVRCQLWNELPQTPEVKTAMQRDAKALINGIQREGNVTGFYTYNVGIGKAYSLSRAHYAVLGVWAAAQSGYEVPNAYWQFVERSWIAQQDPTGGWSYKGRDFKAPKGEDSSYPVTPGMTADGIATLFITQDFLHADEAISPHGNLKNRNIDKAMEWMSANFDKVAKDEKFARDYPFATLYAIERIGAASGFKYFSNIDWYDVGAERLIRNQRSNGSWRGDLGGFDVSGTSFALLFLARGRAPVVMNKLEYDLNGGKTEGNWNQRPRDVANVTRWIGRQSERELNWQITNLNGPVTELHDAPILFIAGNQELKLTKEQTDKLRGFIEGGGLILANADATALPFVTSFKKLGKELFPAYEFRQLPADHTIFTNEQFPAAQWKRKPAVLALGNGAREFMLILPDTDLSRTWQVQETSSRSELFQLAANIFLYSADKNEVRNKGETYLVQPDTRIKPTRTIALARLKFSGNWNPEPGGWRRMAAILNNQNKVGLDVITVDPATESLTAAKVAHLTGVGKFKFNDLARAAIKKFVTDGGTLIVDAAGGNGEFAQSAESELSAIFGASAAEQLKEPLPLEHPVYSIQGRKIEDIGWRTFARQKLMGELKGPRLRGIKIGDRLAVIYSPEDLSIGLVGMPIDGIVGYKPATATALMRSILLGAFSSPATTHPATKNSGQ